MACPEQTPYKYCKRKGSGGLAAARLSERRIDGTRKKWRGWAIANTGWQHVNLGIGEILLKEQIKKARDAPGNASQLLSSQPHTFPFAIIAAHPDANDLQMTLQQL
jgi:hypothetical protein